MTATPPAGRRTPSRRTLLTGSAALAATTAVGSCGDPAERSTASAPAPKAGARPATRQRGIAEPQPRYALVAGLDLAPARRTPASVRPLRAALAAWAALPLPPRATLTVALGPALFPALGLPAPAVLRALPPFPRDRLDPRRGGGDVLVQLCAEGEGDAGPLADLLTATASGLLVPRWRERGFLPPHAPGETPRNLFGFKDGTENPPSDEADRWVWHPDGSTVLVYRRIHMRIPDFAALPPGGQEEVIGRRLASGAPLTGRRERDPVDLYAKTPEGRYLIPSDAHVRLAHSRLDGGARMLRRGYSYDNGPGDRGLLFLAYMRDPALFGRVQRRLDDGDALRVFTEHRASALGLVLPAPGPGRPFGHPLLDSARA
ncbi:Dyp-type peroxidase [Streptomyces sp. NPDC050504]|uniref:Dyp-type peroxidase n=1 Tax=Streptomyces sp. NPDC050504 TaxID=3365618 RepID=UPI0037A20EA9